MLKKLFVHTGTIVFWQFDEWNQTFWLCTDIVRYTQHLPSPVNVQWIHQWSHQVTARFTGQINDFTNRRGIYKHLANCWVFRKAIDVEFVTVWQVWLVVQNNSLKYLLCSDFTRYTTETFQPFNNLSKMSDSKWQKCQININYTNFYIQN